jgi:endonuclease G
MVVDLPSVDRHADDVLDFKVDGKSETELRYEHYSVVMSRSRRMCFFSAVNIDGNQSNVIEVGGGNGICAYRRRSRS